MDGGDSGEVVVGCGLVNYSVHAVLGGEEY